MDICFVLSLFFHLFVCSLGNTCSSKFWKTETGRGKIISGLMNQTKTFIVSMTAFLFLLPLCTDVLEITYS